jgi:hypothetical protein
VPIQTVTPKAVAQLLAARFLADGRFTAAGVRPGSADDGMLPSTSIDLIDLWSETAGFSGMAVQAVGYQVGVEVPEVMIYATKGSKRDFDQLPNQIGNVAVTVRKFGVLRIDPHLAAAASTIGNVYHRKGRIACGSSCAPAGEEYAGTFGALVKKRDKVFALSNNHILAAGNHTPLEMPVQSPANRDGRRGLPATSFAKLSEISALRSGNPEMVVPCGEDIAIAEVVLPNRVSSWQGDKNGCDTPSGIVDPKSGMRVKKVGRTSGLTFGNVEAEISEPMPALLQTRNFKGIVWFKDIWTINAEGAIRSPCRATLEVL